MLIYNTYRKPCQALSRYIDRFWWHEANAGDTLPTITPGVGTELIIHYRNAYDYQFSKQVLRAPQAHIICCRSGQFRLSAKSAVGFIGIRFRGGALRHFGRFSMQDIADDFVSAEDVLGNNIATLTDMISELSTIDEKVSVIERFLLRQLARNRRDELLLDNLAKRLYYQSATLTIEEVADNSGYSRRHFQRLFKNSLGVTPKNYISCAKFERSLRQLLLKKQTNYAPVVHDFGYYDQSHYIKEWQRYLACSPSAFLNKANFMSHFYNTSLNNHGMISP